MMTITIWPQDCGRTKLIAEWHFHPDEIAKPDFVFEDAIEFWDRTNREDWAISEQSYLGISSRGYRAGALLRAREAVVGVRSVHPVTDGPRRARKTRSYGLSYSIQSAYSSGRRCFRNSLAGV